MENKPPLSKRDGYQQQKHVWYGFRGAIGARFVFQFLPSFPKGHRRSFLAGSARRNNWGNIIFRKQDKTEKPQNNNKNKTKTNGIEEECILSNSYESLSCVACHLMTSQP